MKNRTMILAAAIAALSTTFAHAGNERGNGGGAWVCRNADNSIRTSDLVDLYEGREEFGFDICGVWIWDDGRCVGAGGL